MVKPKILVFWSFIFWTRQCFYSFWQEKDFCVLIPYKNIWFLMFKTCPPKYLILKGEWNKFFYLQFLWSCKIVSMMQTNSKLQILCYSPFKKDNKCIWMSTQEAFTYSSITHEWHNTHDCFQEHFCRHSVRVAAGLNQLLLFPAEPWPPAIASVESNVVLGFDLQLKEILGSHLLFMSLCVM